MAKFLQTVISHGVRWPTWCWVLALWCFGCPSSGASVSTAEFRSGSTVTQLRVEVIASAPHDERAFTQGLVIGEQGLFESSGLYGRSFVTRRSRATGEVLAKLSLPRHLFAEGLTLFDDRLLLLTWKAGQAMVLDPETLDVETRFQYPGEGWGITHDGRELIMSNGTDRLTFRDPETFASTRVVQVSGGGRDWRRLNELEFAQGLVWANQWLSDGIAAIDPATGEVRGWADLSQLAARHNHRPSQSVLNGIAFDEASQTFLITGKLWSAQYTVKFHWPEKDSR